MLVVITIVVAGAACIAAMSLALPLPVAAAAAVAEASSGQQTGEAAVVSIRATRQFAGQLLPLAESGGYVSYELTVSNDGGSEIGEGHELLVRLSSEGGRSYSQASFSVGSMEPGEERLFHTGPFKIAEGGPHSFHAHLAGPSVAKNGAYVDSFVAYGAGTGAALAAGAAVAAAGLGLVILQRVRSS